jgi:hypothetical protein
LPKRNEVDLERKDTNPTTKEVDTALLLHLLPPVLLVLHKPLEPDSNYQVMVANKTPLLRDHKEEEDKTNMIEFVE